MKKKKIQFSFGGALESPKDSRTIQHSDLAQAGAPLVSGGIEYLPEDIDNQFNVGICTAIHITQNRGKKNGKKYSPEFQYLLQKKFYDKNWDEGSSIFYALKVAKNYGFLPQEIWTTVVDKVPELGFLNESDRKLTYAKFIAKLKLIPDEEITRLIGLCVDKIAGYAAVDISDAQKIAKAVNDSGVGILCRYIVGKEWYTSIDGRISWAPKDINPIRPPVNPICGHAITMSAFDYTNSIKQTLPNTWGKEWCRNGSCDILFDSYKPTEAWIILDEVPVVPEFKFLIDLYYGIMSPDVKQLQIRLNKDPRTQVASTGAGSPGNETEFFGGLTLRAVKKYQILNGIKPVYGYVGPITREVLNR